MSALARHIVCSAGDRPQKIASGVKGADDDRLAVPAVHIRRERALASMVGWFISWKPPWLDDSRVLASRGIRLAKIKVIA